VTDALDGVAAVCMVAGALLSLAAGVALVRFPDLPSRMHAATKPQVLGLLLVLLGCGLRLRDTVDITTLVLVAVFQLSTAPVAAHMVGRAAYRAGQVRKELLLVDELDPKRPESERPESDWPAERPESERPESDWPAERPDSGRVGSERLRPVPGVDAPGGEGPPDEHAHLTVGERQEDLRR
jgi:multicomponent Na+:H+ antiporter subunit G